MQIGQLAGVLLPGVDASDVDAIRSIGDVEARRGQPDEPFGVEVHQDPADRRRQGGAGGEGWQQARDFG